MLRGYRGIFVALAGLALCGANPPSEQAQSNNGTEKASPTPPTPTYTPYPQYKAGPCYYAKDHDSADLCAQWRAAIAAEKAAHEARRANSWAIVTTLLSALSFGVIAWALWLTARNNYIAYHAERAFLYLKPRVSRKGDTIKILVKNRGHSPANVLGQPIIVPFDTLPDAKVGLTKPAWAEIELSMSMEVVEPDTEGSLAAGDQPSAPYIRVQVLYMTVFNRKCTTIGFYEAKGLFWVLKQHTGWLHMT